MKTLVLVAVAASAVLALLRRRKQQGTMKGRLINYSKRIKSKL